MSFTRLGMLRLSYLPPRCGRPLTSRPAPLPSYPSLPCLPRPQVMQDDLLFSALTVWETVQTAALLRLPSSISRAARRQLAEGVVQQLGERKRREDEGDRQAIDYG